MEEDYKLDFTKELDSYFYGLVLADGSLIREERNRGRVSIELSSKDAKPLELFSIGLPWKSRVSRRDRISPYNGSNFSSTTYVCHSKGLREQLVDIGFPLCEKSFTCYAPSTLVESKAFWRGYFDGDGSLGVTSRGFPFLSLTLVSEELTEQYYDLVQKLTGFRPKVNRNKRDNVRNVVLTRDKAIKLAQWMYEDSTVFIPRKKDIAMKIVENGMEKE